MEFLSLLVVGGVVWAVVALARYFKQRWLATLHAVALRCGLTVNPGTFWRSGAAQGLVQGVPLTLDTYTVSTGKSSATYTRVAARPPWLPADFTLKPEGLGASLGKLFLGADLALGDERFDEAVVVRADERLARAVLDVDTRQLVRVALDAGIVVEDGQIRWVKGGVVHDVDLLAKYIGQVAELARALEPGDVRARLLKVVQTDPDIEVATGALQILQAQWRLTPEEQQRLLAHPRATVRLAVAPFLGAQAWQALEALFDDVRQASTDRIRALELLDRIDRPHAVRFALDRVTRTQPTEIAVALLDHLAAAETCPPLADLAELVGLRSEALRRSLARILFHSKAAAEAQLLELLADSDDEVAALAARGLARHGSPAAVARLRERAKGFLVDGDLKRAVEAAIAAIQQQVGPLGGSLSLLRERTTAGGLSPATEEES